MKKYLITISSFLLLVVIFSSCSKSYRLIKKGEFTKTSFLEEIDFRYSNNLILIDVQIEGRSYSCVLDTGAEVSVFDSSLLDKITHKEVANQKVSGAAGVKNTFKFLEIPKINIGSLEFLSLVAISSDLSPIAERFKCDETIHGIIGSNMMRKAVWRIDYQQQKVWISDKLSSFDDLQNDLVINLECGKVGSVYINTSLDGVDKLFTFDTGKSRSIQTNSKIFDSLLEQNENLEYTQSKGVTGITLNGIQYGTTNYTLINETKIGGILLDNKIIEIRNNERASSLIGNKIWENYRVTIDWDNCHLYLKPNQKIEQDTFHQFEYSISSNPSENGFKLINEWLQHPSKLDINQNNEIITIEGIDVSNLNLEEYCSFIKDKLPLLKKQDTISLLLLNDGKEEKITLNRKRLLPK